jgi:Carboxypeptidase regulatory-like domain
MPRGLFIGEGCESAGQTFAPECSSSRNASVRSGVKGNHSVALSIVSMSLFLFALCALPAWGQAVATGTVVGTVTDNSGAVVAGASVTLVDNARGDTRTTTTNDVGHYIFSNTPPATYTIKFKKSGFSEFDITNATVLVGTQLNENVQMKLGSVSTTVTVTETAGAELQTMNATVGNTVTGTALDSLPALGRDAGTFMTLQPGVSPDGAVAGAVEDQSTFTLDGGQNSNDMDGTMATYTVSYANDPTGGAMGGAPTGVMPTPIDSVEEFKVNTAGQTADFNSSAGAQVEMVTRRGTSNWHGSVYEYYLDNNWNANSWTNNNTQTPLPDYHYSRFGGRVGGPIIPKEILGGKTYFFANYEGFRWPNVGTYAHSVPSPNMEVGILTFSGVNYNIKNYDPRGIGIDPTIQAMWQKYEPQGTPAGCGAVGGGSRCDGVNEFGFVGNIALPQTSNFGVTRFDHDFGTKWHLNTTYHYCNQKRATDSQVDIGGVFPGDTLGTAASLSNRPQQTWFYTAGLTTNISPNVTNDFHYSYLRNFWAWETANAPPQPGTDSTGVLEPFGESATQDLAPYNVNTQQVRTRFWDGHDNYLRDDITVLHSNHLFQFGGIYQRNWDYHQRTDNGGGINYTLTYQIGDTPGAGLVNMSSLYAAGYVGGAANETAATDRAAAAVLGIVTDSQVAYTRSGASLTLNPPLTPAFDQSTIPYYNVYFSDSWHMKPSFTLTFGLGYTIEMPPTEVQGKQVEVVDASGQMLNLEGYLAQRKAFALQGQVYNPEVGYALVSNVGSGLKYPYNPYYGSFSPRISAAWNPQFSTDTFMGKLFGGSNTVIRGGYNRIYGRLNGVDQVLVPLLGEGLIQPTQCKLALASGACGPTTPTAGTAFRIGVDGNTAPIPAATPTLPQPIFPGFNNVAAAAGEGFDTNFRPNAIDSFDLTIQRQLSPKLILEVGYIGRRITHEYQPVNINAVPYMMTLGGQTFASAYAAVENALGCTTSFVQCGANPGAVVPVQPFFEAALSGTGYCNGFSSCTAAVVSQVNPNAASGSGEFGSFTSQSVWGLWSDLDNGGIGGAVGGGTAPGWNFPRSMLNSPIAATCTAGNSNGCSGQMSGGVALNASIGYGNYNGAFFSFKSTDWHGVTSQQNFTFSRALGTGADVQATSEYTPDDPFNLNEMYGRQNFDHTFVYNLYIAYQPPIYKGQHGLIGRLAGGWSLAPIFAAGTGNPQECNTLSADSQSFGAGDGVNYADNENCLFTTRPPSPSVHETFHPASGASPAYTEVNYFANPAAVAATARAPILGLDQHDGGTGVLSNLPYWNMDLQLKKLTNLSERFSIETQFMFLNVFNHPQFNAASTGNDPLDIGNLPNAWGDSSAQANNPRAMEFGIRLNF